MMLYHLANYVLPYSHKLHVIHYVSFRAIAALLTALGISFLFGDRFIERSRTYTSAAARAFTPDSHKAKGALPTMGGVFILCVVFITTILWNNLLHHDVWIMLTCLCGFGAIGLWDDILKIRKKRGITEKQKFCTQVLIAGVVGVWFWSVAPTTEMIVPFCKNWYPSLGLLLIPWVIFILVGTSNAVNLTDGLDGLAVGSLLPNFATFALLAYIGGHKEIAAYLHVPYVGTSEIAIMGSTLFGACLGFLWYNTYPAQIFMGDVGSLALGASLALLAIMSRQELLLPLAGGLFVVETVSVIVQIIGFRFFGKRLFKMAPIHHHFELIGWPESRIVTRFAIITFVLCLLAILTIKIR
jgi:phospho-N-acetylmuramoyl-pentapeptide-transferase